VFTECKNTGAGPGARAGSLCRARGGRRIGGSTLGAPSRAPATGGNDNKVMKKLGFLVAIAALAWVMFKVRDKAVNLVDVSEGALARQRAKGFSAMEEKQELEKIASHASGTGRAEDEIDRSPFHLLATTPAGRYLRIAVPLTFHAREPVRLVLEIHPDLVADDMPLSPGTGGAPSRPDLRVANTSFEVTFERAGAAGPVPYRAACSLAPEPSDISVSLEIGGNHDAFDAASKKIKAQEHAWVIGSAEARRQLEALQDSYVPNTKGTYQVRAVYRNGKLVTAPVTVVITD